MADSIVETCKKRFQRAKDSNGTLRQQAIEDTKFVLGDSENKWQWPADVWDQRANVNKPNLTINVTRQHCNQIENQIRQNRPSAKVLPQDGTADIETAEILGGMLRSIQSYSNADTAHDIAAKHSIFGGEGFWRVITEYETADSFDQVITIKPLVNPQLVYIDPDAIQPDRSDARWGIIFEDVPRDQFENEDAYDNDAVLGWGDDGSGGWCNKDTIRRAEYYWCEDKDDTLYRLSTGQVIKKSELPEGAKVNEKGKTISIGGDPALIFSESRKTTTKQWKWARIVGGKDEPEEEKDWAGSYLPIIMVVGDETNVNGEIVRKGLVRDLKDTARLVNYAYSAAVETTALQTKVPWLASAESLEGHEAIWGSANIENRAYLPWNAYDENGQQLPRPERVQPAAMATAQVQMLSLSVEQMRAASGQQNANFGIKSDAQSGVGIQRLKVQGEVATFHFPDNLSRGLKYEATVIIDLIPKIYDTKRIVRILGMDGTEKKVMMDPDHQGQPQQIKDDQQGIEQVFNPLVGRYDIAIDTGPSYQTQRQESAAAIGELAGKAPIVMQTAPDLVFKSMDFPMAQEFADRFKKTLPPQLLDDDGNKEQQLMMQLQQSQQAMQQLQGESQQNQQVIGKMQQHIDKLELMIRGDTIKTQGQLELERIRQRGTAAKGVADHGINAYKAETDRIEAVWDSLNPFEKQALVAQTVQESLAAQPLQPEMDNPTISIPINPMDGVLPTPPEMAVPGTQPGPSQDVPPEGNLSNV